MAWCFVKPGRKCAFSLLHIIIIICSR